MSKTFYVPDEAGWESTGSHYARFRVDQQYDASSNSSVLDIKLEGYSRAWSYTLNHLLGSISVNGEEVLSGGATNDSMQFARDAVWRTMQKNGEDAVWRVTVQHNADGSATVPFQLGNTQGAISGFQLRRTISGTVYNAVWNIKTGTLELSEQRGNIRVGVNGMPTLGQLYIGVNGDPKMAELYIGVSGVPVKAV